MKKIQSLFKEDSKYLLTGFSLLLICLLLVTTMHSEEDFTLNLPTSNMFTIASWVIIVLLGIFGILFIKNIDKKNIKLEKVFLILVIPIGIITSLSRPLGRIPDEVYHSRKAMAIAQGNFFSKQNEEGKATDYFNSKLNELVTLDSKDYREALRRLTLAETEDMVELEYTTMALYSPVCHLPQAFAMFIIKLFKGSVPLQCYAARLANFAVSVFLIYEAIKLIPTKKILVLFLGLLPITIQEIVSMSVDALTISISIFYISYIFYLKYDESKAYISNKDIIVLLITSLVVSLCKIVYLPLCLLLIILPKEKFKSNKIKNIVILSIILLSVILNLIWMVYCSRFLIEFNIGVNSGEQVKYVLTHPFSYFLTLFRSMNEYQQIYIVGLCGESLGVYDAQSSVIFITPCMLIFAMIILVNDENDKIQFDTFTKLTCFTIFAITVALIYTSLYVQWTVVKSPLIYGVQSRYFLPILLLTDIFLRNSAIVYKKKDIRYIILFMLFLNLNTISVILYRYHIGV